MVKSYSNIAVTWLINLSIIKSVDFFDVEMVLKIILLSLTIIWTMLRIKQVIKKKKEEKEDASD